MLCEHSIVRNNNRVRRNGRKHDSFLGIDDSACRDDARLGMCIFSERQTQRAAAERAAGFASGVMVAASVWSLLIPSMDMAAGMGRLAFVPAAAGMLLGMAFLLGMDRVVPHLHLGTQEAEGPKTSLKKTTMLVLAVTLHNIPEGMAVGVVFAGMLSGSTGITAAGAFSLAIGIAIQNFPEGAIISMPLKSEGQMSAKRRFVYGSFRER